MSTSHPGKHRAHLRLGAAAAGVAALLAGCVGTGATRTAAPERTPSRRPARVLQATLAAYRLPAPLSRAVVFNAGSDLLVAGGLTAGSSSASGVFRLDPTTGTLTSDGRLAAPVHDAAGVTLDGGNLVLGGGAQATTANVQRLRDGGTAQLIGRLPQPRSDLVAATVGQAAYVLGGYDGATTQGAVLRTQDGRSFTSIGQLPVPVRYPAVAVTGRTLWVFGGEHAGQQVDTIQRIDTATGSARVAGHLQHPLAHAAALVLDGTVYLAGGRAGNSVTNQMLAFDADAAKVTPAGQLPRPVADTAAGVVGEVGYLIGGEGPRPLSTVIKLRTVSAAATPTTQPSNRATRNAAGWPFAGRLLIADRGNNRLLLADPAKHVLWRYPSPAAPAPAGGFYFPDDAFFVRKGTAILSNEEENHTFVEIAFPSGRLLWSYGHPHVAGRSPGYLNQSDDAYLLRSGQVAVADALNCRILLLSPARAVAGQIGTTGDCTHAPPRALGYPNGDTPLADGNLLISEIHGSWVSEYTVAGGLVWTVHLPIAYPTDPQQLGPDAYLVADYARPGGLYEFNRKGRILWRYRPATGAGMLDHPSLAERLPNGLIAVNDDYRNRIVALDSAKRAIVWQYGTTDRAGRAAGLLHTPDGYDLLAADDTTPTHPQTG